MYAFATRLTRSSGELAKESARFSVFAEPSKPRRLLSRMRTYLFLSRYVRRKRLRPPPYCFKTVMSRSHHLGFLEEKVYRKEEKERLKRDSNKRVGIETEACMKIIVEALDGLEKFRFSGEIGALQKIRKDRTRGYE